MASFISKLSRECDQHQKILDRSSIKTIRFKNDMSTQYQILGPLFKATIPPAIIGLLKEHCLSPLLQGFEWSRWDAAKPQGSWPSTTTTWAAWVVRMERLFGEQWKALGIYDAILLSSMEIVFDKELLLAALCFWCSATNTMVLPLGPIGPTILDIIAILGTSATGIPVDATLSGHPSNIDLKTLFDRRAFETLNCDGHIPSKEDIQKLHKNFCNYNTLYLHFAGQGEEDLREGEHEAFLFYWYNKYICCTKSNKCLVENMPVAEALASGHVLALSSNILAQLFRCLAEVTLHKVDPHQNGPLWVFQLWLQVYFASLRPAIADFSPTEALGPQLASRPTLPHQAEEVFRYLFALDDFSNDEFLICRRRDYPSFIRLPTSTWSAEEDADLRQIWGSFVLARDLPLGCDGKRSGWEVYHPNFLARQLGYLQGCPTPLLSSRTVLSRGREPRSSKKECRTAVREFQERCQKFRLRLATPETHCTDTFGEWWENYTQEFFGAPVEDVLSRLFGDRPKKASAPYTQGSQPLRKTEAVAAAMAGKKSVVAQKDKPAGRAVLIKRPRQEAEPAVEPSPPAKRVKQLAKKGAREIHVISSHTTGTTTPSVSPSPAAGQPLIEKQPTSVTKTAQARPVSVAGAPVVPPSAEKAPVPQQAVSTAEGPSPKNPKPSVFVLEESEGSDEVPLAHRPHPRRQPPLVSETTVQAGPSTADRDKRPVEEPTVVAEPLAPSQEQGVPASEAAVPVGPSTADRGKRPVEEPKATAESPVHPQDQGFHIPPQEVTSAFWPSNVDNLHRPRELRSNLRHWARPLSSLGSSNDPGDMAEVSSRQASWEVEFKALLSSTTAESGPSAAPTEATDPNALTQLREVLSLSASQVLERNGLDRLGVCLNDLGADGRLSGDAIVRASSALEQVWETFNVFQTALKAEQDLHAATAVQDTLRPKIDDLRVKGEVLAELDRQMAELAKRRSAVASELARDFESGGKDRLTEYVAATKRVERLKLDKKNRQAEVIMADVRWLELKALLNTLLPSSP
ncbi:hypothetical protein ACFX1X_004219 [Malus domestica]